MTPAAYLGVAAASLAGSIHCAAMCGGFVAAYSSADQQGSRAAAHALYNGGRLVTYVALGGVAGALGGALDLAGRAAGVAQVAAIVTGVLLLVSGIAGLAPRPALLRLRRAPARPLAGRVTRLIASFREKPPAVRAALLGLTSTLLPCGWLYAFAALAAATGGAASGALLMSAFWLGSLPVLLGLGVSLETVARRVWARLPRLRPVLVLSVGAVTLLSRFQMPAFAATEEQPRGANAALPQSDDCPCHLRPGTDTKAGSTPQGSP